MMNTSLSINKLQTLENDLVQFLYRHLWNQKWSGHGLPKDLFRSFASHARNLSDAFTLNRKNLKEHYFRTKESRSAYLLYFHLANVVRTTAVLDELLKHGFFKKNKNMNVFDFGAGWGASSWAMVLFAKQHSFDLKQVCLADKDRSILKDAQALIDHQELLAQKVSYFQMDAFDPRTLKQLARLKPLDVVFMTNILNEDVSHESKWSRLIGHIIEHVLSDEGVLIILEPALQRLSRQLTLIRDEVLKTTKVYSVLPCLHDQPCPLNLESRDWCHFEVKWQAPSIRAKIEKFLFHQTGVLKYSYIVFSKQNFITSKGNRVISDVLKTPQGYTLLTCTPDGKKRLDYQKSAKVYNPYPRGSIKGA